MYKNIFGPRVCVKIAKLYEKKFCVVQVLSGSLLVSNPLFVAPGNFFFLCAYLETLLHLSVRVNYYYTLKHVHLTTHSTVCVVYCTREEMEKRVSSTFIFIAQNGVCTT